MFRTRYFDFTAKHFHEQVVGQPMADGQPFRRSYSLVKSVLQLRGLTTKAPRRGVHRRKRERRPLPGMMLFQDGSKHAWLGQPQGIAIDSANNVYISDTNNCRIRKVDTNGNISTFAGNGTCTFAGDNGVPTGASLSFPLNLAIDQAGNLYIADTSNQRIRKIGGGIITTVAGNGVCAFSGDGGPATAASICNPGGVGLDASGNLYIADTANNRIREVSGGTITTVAGSGCCFYGDGGPAVSAGLNSPQSVAFDSAGNMYIAEQNNNRVRKVSAGIITTFAGNGLYTWAGDGGPAAIGSFAGPIALAFSASGDLYVSDSGNRRVRKIDGSGNLSTFAGNGLFKFAGDGGQATSANLNAPVSAVMDSSGNLFVMDSGNAVIRKVNSSGVISTIAGNHNFGFAGDGGTPASAGELSNNPSYSAVDSAGNLYFSDESGNRIRKIDTNGNITTLAGDGNCCYSGDGGPAVGASINTPAQLAFDPAGNLYFADRSNQRIRKVDLSGNITTVAGTGVAGYSGDGGLAINAQLAYPEGLGFDSAGNLFISEPGTNNRIRMVSPSGIITTIAGTGVAGYFGDGGAATSAMVNYPTGIAVDPAGNVFFVDRNNLRIRKIDRFGNIFTVAGNGTCCYSGDGGSATSARINYGWGLFIDSAGSLYYGDQNNDRIRKIAGIGTLGALSRLTITNTSPLPTGALNAAYSDTLTAVGGTGARTWSLAGGVLPTGVTLNAATGLLSGTATGAGSFTFTIQVRDSGLPQQTASATYTVQIALGNGSTLAFSTQPQNAAAGAAQGVAVTVLNGANPVAGAVVAMTIGNNPAGGTLSGTLSATANAGGVASFPNLSINAADNGYTLVATVAGSAVTSNTFNVTPQAGNIITVAGHNWTFSNPSGLAVNAPIAPDHGILKDSAGNLIFSDSGNNQVVKATPGGVLTVIAGNGACCFSGDGGPAVDAQLNYPTAVALDAAGNLYIADTNNRRIRKVTPAGTISTIAGNGNYGYSGDGGLAINAAMGYPYGVAADQSNNVYLTDSSFEVVRKISNGVITTIAGTGLYGFSGDGGPATAAMFEFPDGIVVDSANNIYIADENNNRVRKIDNSGMISTVAGNNICCNLNDGGAATSAWLSGPQSVSVDGNGNLYIADSGNSRIRKVSSGNISTIAGGGSGVNGVGYGFAGDGGPATSALLDDPTGVYADNSNNVYLIDYSNQRVRMVAPNGNIGPVAGNGKYKYAGDGGLAASANLHSPRGVALDNVGNIYIADISDNHVRKVTAARVISTIAGAGMPGYSGDGGPAINASLGQYVASVAADVNGNVYIADWDNGRVRKIDASGNITTFAGGGNLDTNGVPATSVYFPGGVQNLALDAAGNLYISEYYSYRIRKVSPAGIITTVAGNGTQGFSGDGGLATNAQLSYVTGIAVDPNGNLYINDTGNYRVRRVTPGGTITTIAGNGVQGYSGDGGPALNAAFGSYAQGLAADANGVVYIGDGNSCRVRRIDTTGTITLYAGNGNCTGGLGDGGPATGASLGFPSEIKLDAAGNLYIADQNGDRIRMVANEGLASPTRLTITTTSTPAATQNSAYNQSLTAVGGTGNRAWSVISGALPTGMTFNGGTFSGTPTVAGTFNLTVQVTDSASPQQSTTLMLALVVNPVTGTTMAFTTQPANTPSGTGIPAVQVTLTPASTAYITMSLGLNPSGGTLSGTLTQQSVNGVATFNDLSVNNGGNGYTLVAAVGNLQATSNAFNIVPPGGSIITYAGKPWQFSNPSGLAVGAPLGFGFLSGLATDGSGNVYIADAQNNMVFKMTGTNLSVVAGTGVAGFSGDGALAVNAQLNSPSGVALDASGNVYIVEQNNQRVRKVNLSGIISTVAGNGVYGFSGDGGPATAASFSNPDAIAVDSAGNIYIGDSNNYRVRKVDTSGNISTVAGNGNCCYSGDGPATSVSLGQVNALAVDASGAVYLGEQQDRVRKLSGGMLTAIAGTGNCCNNGDGPALATNVDRPSGLVVSPDGSNLWIVDLGNNRLRLLNNGNIATIAGDGNYAYTDSANALNAEFAGPSGLARDGSGNFYIADGFNKRIRKVVAGGGVTTVAGGNGFRYGGDGGPADQRLWSTTFPVWRSIFWKPVYRRRR